MLETIQLVKTLAPNAHLDCCPFENGEDGTGFFIRVGLSGHWLSKVRKNPRAAWANAAQRMRAKSDEPPSKNGSATA